MCLPIKPSLLDAVDKGCPMSSRQGFLLRAPNDQECLPWYLLAFTLVKPSQDLCLYLGSQLPECEREKELREEGVIQW